MGANVRVLKSDVICRQPGRYIGWPTIARDLEGDLFVVFSGDRDAHCCPYAKTFFMRSEEPRASRIPSAVLREKLSATKLRTTMPQRTKMRT